MLKLTALPSSPTTGQQPFRGLETADRGLRRSIQALKAQEKTRIFGKPLYVEIILLGLNILYLHRNNI